MICAPLPAAPVSLDTPSRLKGIETHTIKIFIRMQLALDTPSRLKGIETFTPTFISSSVGFGSALDTPSRLKGIETQYLLLCAFYA